MRQGRGMFHPPPRQHHPHGVIPHGYSLWGSGSLFAVSPDTPPKILPPLPVHSIRCYRHALPAPSGGGGRRPRERPGGGGVPAKTVQRETHETGAGQPQKTSQRRGDPGHHTMSDLALWAFIPAPPGEPLNWSLTGAGIVVLLVAVTNIPPNKRISSQMSWHSLTG